MGSIAIKFNAYDDQDVFVMVIFTTALIQSPFLCFFLILQGVPSSTETDDHGLPTNFESGDIHIAGLVVSSYSWEHSHWAARQSLSQWLVDKQVPGIYGIDTRALTKKIREFGALLGNIVVVSCCY